MKRWYQQDLAFIHDDGFKEFALRSAPGLLDILSRAHIRDGLVVDLGCGSGLWARELVAAHYQVLGIDISEAMIRIARKRVPDAEFRVESLFTAILPRCNAVTSISECLNYLFDVTDDETHPSLLSLFRRVYRALSPGGVFIFDIAEPGQVKPGMKIKSYSEGAGWLVLVEKEEDQNLLTRRIISLRKIGKHYRRADETHRQKLYCAAEVAAQLRRVGFLGQIRRRYGSYPLPRAHAAFIARKPV
jgi:SAM-dependent methyltransferase